MCLILKHTFIANHIKLTLGELWHLFERSPRRLRFLDHIWAVLNKLISELFSMSIPFLLVLTERRGVL